LSTGSVSGPFADIVSAPKGDIDAGGIEVNRLRGLALASDGRLEIRNGPLAKGPLSAGGERGQPRQPREHGGKLENRERTVVRGRVPCEGGFLDCRLMRG
jgi:hypothetical protein